MDFIVKFFVRISNKNSSITWSLKRGSFVMILRKQSGLFMIKRFNSIRLFIGIINPELYKTR